MGSAKPDPGMKTVKIKGPTLYMTRNLIQENRRRPFFSWTGFAVGFICSAVNFLTIYWMAFAGVKIAIIGTLSAPVRTMYFPFIWPVLLALASGSSNLARKTILVLVWASQIYWLISPPQGAIGVSDYEALSRNLHGFIYSYDHFDGKGEAIDLLHCFVMALWALTTTVLYAVVSGWRFGFGFKK